MFLVLGFVFNLIVLSTIMFVVSCQGTKTATSQIEYQRFNFTCASTDHMIHGTGIISIAPGYMLLTSMKYERHFPPTLA